MPRKRFPAEAHRSTVHSRLSFILKTTARRNVRDDHQQ